MTDHPTGRREDIAAVVDVPGQRHRMWIGGATAPVPRGVRAVVTVADEVAPLEAAGVEEHRHSFDDTRWRPIPQDALDAAVRATRTTFQAGDVLVRCHRGANRSSLVVALVLRHAGLSGDEAIAAVRGARSLLALSNPYFAALVRQWPDDPMGQSSGNVLATESQRCS